MQIGDWETTADLNDVYRDVVKHDLVENVAELEAFGFTVVPPEKVAPPEFQQRLRQAVLDVHERRTGQRIADPETGRVAGDAPVAADFGVLLEDRVFEEAVLIPAVYTLARYQCGKSAVLGLLLAMLKNQDPRPTHPRLHTDQIGIPPPLPQYPYVNNITWVLTDYTPDNGPVAIVPGSHRFGREPNEYEENFLVEGAPVKAIPVEARAGSLIVWGGTTWHGSFPRKAPGLRMNLIFSFYRLFMRPLNDFTRECPPEIIERNPPEFAQLLGFGAAFPAEGLRVPVGESIARYQHAGKNPWA